MRVPLERKMLNEDDRIAAQPEIEILEVSCTTGAGLAEWNEWIEWIERRL